MSFNVALFKSGKTCRKCKLWKLSNEIQPCKRNSDGFERRYEGTGITLYRKLLKSEMGADNFQLMCHNRNFSKHIGAGICVYERKEVRYGV